MSHLTRHPTRHHPSPPATVRISSHPLQQRAQAASSTAVTPHCCWLARMYVLHELTVGAQD
eukprot:4733868-Prymnesium_polylepis.1